MTGKEGDSDKISFDAFVRSMLWWQKADVEYKLECNF